MLPLRATQLFVTSKKQQKFQNNYIFFFFLVNLKSTRFRALWKSNSLTRYTHSLSFFLLLCPFCSLSFSFIPISCLSFYYKMFLVTRREREGEKEGTLSKWHSFRERETLGRGERSRIEYFDTISIRSKRQQKCRTFALSKLNQCEEIPLKF